MENLMTYLQALEYLSKSYNYEKAPLKKRRSFDLGDMQRLAALFGDPERSAPSVHVAAQKVKVLPRR
jgi:folylpolyglutamate synthase/dihydropteroate synthase